MAQTLRWSAAIERATDTVDGPSAKTRSQNGAIAEVFTFDDVAQRDAPRIVEQRQHRTRALDGDDHGCNVSLACANRNAVAETNAF